MDGLKTIFRPFSPSESLGSDRSAGDRQRHRQKIRDTIRKNIPDLLAEEAIIGKSRDRIIKIPIRGVKEYRFIFGDNTPMAGQGSGDSKPGDVIGKSGDEGDMAASPGNEPGVDYYETDITLDELIDIMLEDLELPDLERRSLREVPTEQSSRPQGFRKVGPLPHLSRYQSARQRLKRKFAMEKRGTPEPENGEETRFPFREEDLRYQRKVPDMRPESNAVVFCIMDTSGSMDRMKKYLARSFFFLLYQFVSRKYRNVELAFIAHDSEARKVSEEDFFHKGSSGGTMISSGYALTRDIIKEFYHPSLWNIYIFHCSDGDNFPEDNPETLAITRELCEVANLFGYGEIKPDAGSWPSNSMITTFSALKAENFCTVEIHDKDEVWPAFCKLLTKERVRSPG